MVLFVTLRICSSMNVFSFLGETENYVLTFLTQVVLMVVLPLFLFSKFKKQPVKQTLSDFSIRKISSKGILISIGIGLVVFILNIFISTFFSYFLELLGYHNNFASSTTSSSIGSFFLTLLTVAVLPAICEEFTHRGLLLSEYKKLGFKKAVILSGLMFGLIHLNINQFFYATIIGMVLAVVTLYSRSIFPAMIIHFMNNGLNVYFSFAKARGIFGANFYEKLFSFLFGGSMFSNIITTIVSLTLLIYLLCFLMTSLLKINIKTSLKTFTENMALLAMRQEILSDISPEEKNVFEPPLIRTQTQFGERISVKIPYEVLGFYMEPQIKPKGLDNLFFYSCLILGSLVTLSTFIWGIL